MLRTRFSSELDAVVSEDESKRIRHVRHSQKPRLTREGSPRAAADRYVEEMADRLGIPSEQLRGLRKQTQDLEPEDLGVEYQFAEQKTQFDGTTVSYNQTLFNVPVWRRGVAVKVKHEPMQVVAVTDNSDPELRGSLPSKEAIDRFGRLVRGARSRDKDGRSGPTLALLRETLSASRLENATLLAGRFVAYRYAPDQRFAGHPSPPDERRKAVSIEDAAAPLIKLPAVSGDIRPGEAYLAAELIFSLAHRGFGELVYLTLVEPETGSVLYVECMTQGVNGLVFRRDPMVSSGDLNVTADDGNSVLDDHDADVVLQDLDPPQNNTQSLSGTYVAIQNVEGPNIVPPTKPTGTNFEFQPRTNDFAAVSAYYHQTELFRTIANLGFVIASYFDGTTFPIPVDHRGMSGSSAETINAHWAPNGTGGTLHQCYALCDTTNTAQPLGRAVDPWVHWHEMGGHGTLGDHVSQGTLGFAHSAGDGLAAVQMDPDSALRTLPERFRYAPFRPITTVERRFDRAVPDWAWGSPVVTSAGDLVSGDDLNYGSEQILATCHFRIYRSIGGDHANLARRRFASRVMSYLILRTIGNLTPGTNPSNVDPVTMTVVPGRGAELWCEEMQDVDLENWTSEGLFGGAYNKVIRWSFEQQGNYDSQPPEVDVYIDDGRGGEYPFQATHWHNTSMWNRNSADGVESHQNAVAGATNFMYVKVSNRGTTDSGTVRVKGFHCLPGAGLTWPADFTAMSPAAGLTVASIGAADSETVTLGPFEWVPNENVHGHDCVLMIASTAGDPSNIDNFTGAETIEEWRLVPNDNNVGQRNVTIVPGAGGSEALLDALDGAVFVAGNSSRKVASMQVRATLPSVLARRGWKIDLGDNARFRLKPGEKRKIALKLVKGEQFTPEDFRRVRKLDISVELSAGGMVLGGVTYRIDPRMKRRSGGRPMA